MDGFLWLTVLYLQHTRVLVWPVLGEEATSLSLLLPPLPLRAAREESLRLLTVGRLQNQVR